MIDKYLPIGSVCTLKGNNKKIMIIGFLPIEYNGNLKMYDYQGCSYPEGLLLKNSLIAFNTNDIEKIDFLGYKDEFHDNFNRLLLSNTKQLDLSDERMTTVSNFQFDENGVIIFDGTVHKAESDDKSTISTPDKIENPFNIDYKPVEKIVNPNRHEILSPFKFDENGVIIEDGTSKEEEKQTSPYKFDENGIIIEDGTSKEEEKQSSPFKFDENGIIIDDGTSKKEEKQTSPYTFNEDGIIIFEE